ncbi:type 1 glutamine amidotransferase [Sphingobium yanoikuyae]|jgi:protease I|uniref:Type 1 glutamine amidotransferase n=1 Tax=Sphingobium yanoikuyae TaxID=13690 RepID=A0AA42WYM5_SPHYA|nr:type 1 glutamine amidotransferase [Sphingobium yanoikuyae]MDH2132727.1 type 1 glutamine amidotransferase [Sphingobium yanoikuyae]MDH2149400.1 type 1 glutamine amidotransferase [Sphingobium yanoikuyae]MDH2168140.1 type 1 glutamine amidotransferase [Sphingobium yanoikuyae]
MSLSDRTIALLIAPRGTEEVEFLEPMNALKRAGARVQVIGLQSGQARTNVHDLDPGGEYAVDMTFYEADPASFDGLVIPGGSVGADKLRASREAISFVEAIFDAGKPIGAICHAPWLLIEAKIAPGHSLTSYPSIRTDIENAGGHWVDEEVVIDGQCITSRSPDDLPAFCAALVDAFANASSR